MLAGCQADPEYSIDAHMTSRVAAVSLCEDSTIQCLTCHCEAGLCYIALKKKSLAKKRKSGNRIKCPVHGQQASQHVLAFFEMVQTIASKSAVDGIVWDWCDIPQDHHMHVDATVFTARGHSRFEIDGENHFMDGNTARLATDIAKDAHLRECGAGMLRLHYRDKDVWSAHISRALGKPQQYVAYTPAYIECLEEHEHNGAIESRDKKVSKR